MADHRLIELTKLINSHVESLETQAHYFGMLTSLIDTAIAAPFFEQKPLTSHYYLQAISELLEKASCINEASLALLKLKLSSTPLYSNHSQ